jgi:hypothetical protein
MASLKLDAATEFKVARDIAVHKWQELSAFSSEYPKITPENIEKYVTFSKHKTRPNDYVFTMFGWSVHVFNFNAGKWKRDQVPDVNNIVNNIVSKKDGTVHVGTLQCQGTFSSS